MGVFNGKRRLLSTALAAVEQVGVSRISSR